MDSVHEKCTGTACQLDPETGAVESVSGFFTLSITKKKKPDTSINITCINEKKVYKFHFCDRKYSRPRRLLYPPTDCNDEGCAQSMGNPLL